ncbi:hypothetical protein ABIA33_001488 [Streptacidiphilus sp. MAP12-16]|uniref:hypothetical protein n=1 Tax=Streptacidiphilus sp. MAP12-16 TaxID=3156300 RepID=UPI003516D7D3
MLQELRQALQQLPSRREQQEFADSDGHGLGRTAERVHRRGAEPHAAGRDRQPACQLADL